MTKPATKKPATKAPTKAAKGARSTPAPTPPKPPARRAKKPPPPALAPPVIRMTDTAGKRTDVELPERGQAVALLDGMTATVAHVDELVPSRFNAKEREPDAEMVASITDHGVIEPLVVRPVNPAALAFWQTIGGDPTGRLYEIVCGEKRWKGAQKAEHHLVLVIVRDLTDEQVADLQLVENCHRSDLTPLQEADVFLQHIREFRRTVPEIARRVNKSPGYVAKRVTLQHLPAEGRTALAAGRLLLGAAVEVACLPDAPAPKAPDADRVEALTLVLPRQADEEPLPVRDARDRIVRRFHLRMAGASFDTTAALLVPAAGACTTCPKRTGNQLALFEEGMGEDRCMDRQCWEAKTTAAWELQRAAAEERGLRVLDGQADGAEGQKARAILADPINNGLVPLDAPCDLVHEAKIQAAQARLDQADENGDDEAKAAAEKELDALENGPDEGTLPTWRDVLGTKAQPVALGRRTHYSGRTEVGELVNERAALLVLQQQGVPLPDYVRQRLEESAEPRPAPERPNRHAEHELERRKNTLRRQRLTLAILNAGEEAKPDVGFWRAFVGALVRADHGGVMLGFLPLLQRRAWRTPADEYDEQEIAEIVASEASRMPQQKLRGLACELVCMLMHDDDLATFARHMGQDAGAIIAQADKDAAAELPAPVKKSPARVGLDVKRGTCRCCGCTPQNACNTGGDPPQGCAWSDKGETVCTACAVIIAEAVKLVTDGQPCEHCAGSTACEHFAQELYRRTETAPWLAGDFEQHKARIGACLAHAIAAQKKTKKKPGKSPATAAPTALEPTS